MSTPLGAGHGGALDSNQCPSHPLLTLPHPSGASRWLNEPAHQVLLLKAIAHLRREAANSGLDNAGCAVKLR